MRKLYLCGGINGLSDTDAKDWRQAASEALADLFNIVDPMRRDYRGKEAANVKEIVEGDLEDIKSCRFMLVNAVRPSWGTAMEVMYASSRLSNRLIITVCPADNPSPWLLYHSTLIVKTFEESFACLRRYARKVPE